MKKILIFGAYGYLGNALSNFLSVNYDVFRQGRTSNSDYCFDPINKSSCKKYMKNIKPNIIINLLNVISSSSKNFYAKRNKDMRINVEKYENNFYIKPPDIYQEFRKVIEEY